MTPQAQAQARLLDRLEREHGKSVRKAFEKAVRELRGSVNLSALERAIRAGDIVAAMSVIGISTPVFRDLEVEITRAFEGAGRAFTSLLSNRLRGPGAPLAQLRFDMRHPQAIRWVEANAGQYVTNLAEDMREATIGQLRAEIARGIASDRDAQRAARRIAGLVDPSTGRRTGGVIGLSRPQTEYFNEMRAALTVTPDRPLGVSGFDANGQPIRKFWIKRDGTLGSTYGLRDRRFDPTIVRALRDGQSLPAGKVEQMLNRYSDKMVMFRARTIAETESLTALEAGRFQSMQQAIEDGAVPRQFVKNRWRHSGKREAREDHLRFSGTEVPWGEAFVLPSGARMMFPRDSSLGAGASDIVKCGCMAEQVVDFLAIQEERERNAA